METPLLASVSTSDERNEVFDFDNGMRSCGLFGPAMLGSTVERSRSMISE